MPKWKLCRFGRERMRRQPRARVSTSFAAPRKASQIASGHAANPGHVVESIALICAQPISAPPFWFEVGEHGNTWSNMFDEVSACCSKSTN